MLAEKILCAYRKFLGWIQILTKQTANSTWDKIQLEHSYINGYMYGENEEMQNKKKSQIQAS